MLSLWPLSRVNEDVAFVPSVTAVKLAFAVFLRTLFNRNASLTPRFHGPLVPPELSLILTCTRRRGFSTFFNS